MTYSSMQKLAHVLVLVSLCGLFSCARRQSETEQTDRLYQEMYRPQFHFTPLKGWMNDPNGMVFYDGEYHLFYQHNPDSNVWGPMHWGHAVSKDLIHWEQLPIALYPDSLGTIFSGSAVVDENNTSGLGSSEHPPLVAIFTYHDAVGEKAGRKDFQSQGIAFSTDRGRTWKKYEGNPVLKSPGKRDFRDPKVFWHKPSAQWIMTLAVHDYISFYGSKNLKEWSHLSDFGQSIGAHGGVWECPDLFELNIAADSTKKWILIVNLNPGAFNGGSGTQYFIGQFDGKEFRTDSRETLWLDFGKDNYAGVTWNNIPASDGRRLFIGWMSNWQYANVVPTWTWRCAATIPRELSLVNTDAGLRLASWPVLELSGLAEEPTANFTESMSSTDTLVGPGQLPRLSEINIEVERASPNDNFEIELYNELGENVMIGLEGASNQFYFEKRWSGEVEFSKEFAGRHIGIRSLKSNHIKLTLLVDTSSIELFADDGTVVMTELYFPTEPYNQIKIRSSNQGIKSVKIHSLKTIW